MDSSIAAEASWEDPLSVIDELIQLTSKLATERNLERLLGAILSTATRLTRAEAGRIFALDRSMRQMHCLVSQEQDGTSAAGNFPAVGIYGRDDRYNLTDASVFAAVTGRIVKLADVYRYTGYDFTSTFQNDRRTGCKTRSFVAAPLSGVDGTTIGVLQLVNLELPSDADAGPFRPDAERIVRAIASYAAVAIAIARLFDDNRRLIRQLDRKAEELEKENARLKSHSVEADSPIPGVVADSPPMRHAADLLRRAASSPKVTVLLLGETGAGKDVFAKAIHELSQVRKGPFVAQNCAALPETLLESELFGFRKGAFSGAVADKKGLVQEADGGVLFLDEIGDMPLGLQSKLLRLLEDGSVRRIGDTRAQKVDVRIIAATNADLPRRIAQGAFREDLFYRLSVFPITIPPLRERGADIPKLIDLFLSHVAAVHGRSPPAFTVRALDALASWTFPGNVRELKNIVERAVLLVDEGERIDLRHLPADIVAAARTRPAAAAALARPQNGDDLKSMVRDYEARVIETTLHEAGWNQSRAAALLKISRRSLVEKLGRYAIEQPGGA
ncbi:MAG: sigma 54-interacting transcriptional regulator [Hyphomicrobiales bacterium]|nr:sigma 54-interacting transcriptional regulator [Hyphomicrobiales bacterium]